MKAACSAKRRIANAAFQRSHREGPVLGAIPALEFRTELLCAGANRQSGDAGDQSKSMKHMGGLWGGSSRAIAGCGAADRPWAASRAGQGTRLATANRFGPELFPPQYRKAWVSQRRTGRYGPLAAAFHPADDASSRVRQHSKPCLTRAEEDEYRELAGATRQ